MTDISGNALGDRQVMTFDCITESDVELNMILQTQAVHPHIFSIPFLHRPVMITHVSHAYV